MQDRIPSNSKIQKEKIPGKETKMEWSQGQEDSMILDNDNAVVQVKV